MDDDNKPGTIIGNAVIDAAQVLAGQRVINTGADTTPAVILKSDQSVHALEGLAMAPLRARGERTAVGVDSFAAQVFDADPHNSARIYFANNGVMRAILNHGTADWPGWRDHAITMTPPFHESFKAWREINGQYKTQLDMAEFIEERIVDFVQPAGAAMLELAQKFEIVRTGSFASAVRLATGATSLTLEENTSGKMDITIPERVVLGMRVFDDEPAYQFPAWFRYRVRERALSFCFKIENLERVQKTAVQDLVAKAEGAMPNHKFFQGSAPPVKPL